MPRNANRGKKKGSGGLWRKFKRQKRVTEDIGMTENLGYLTDEDLFYMKASESAASLRAELGETSSDDSFHREVARKTSAMIIGRLEAETEVFIDRLIKREGNSDKALLFAVSKMTVESRIIMIVNNLINRGANTSTSDDELKTPLHYAVKRNLKGVATKLLESDAHPHARDKEGILPLKIAMNNGNDEMCSLLLAYMPNYFVRGLFLSDGHKKCEFSFHGLLQTELKKTILTVLDCMIEHHGATVEGIRVFYNVLESDIEGRPPTDPAFDASTKSPLQIIAKQGDKAVVYHDTIRLLVRKKWKKYARGRFQFNSFLYMLTLFALTYSAIIAVTTPDPTQYGSALHISRAVMEVQAIMMALLTLATEINQIRRHKLEYFHDVFNWLDFSSAVLLITVIPLRFTYNNAQWHVFAFGYLFWTIRIFKFAAVFRQTGAHAQILFRVLANDFPQFTIVFVVILLAFSGSFFLSIRGENDINTHDETSSFWGILFVGVRTLIEAQPVVDYTGDDGYRIISTIVMVCFLFTCCVILLNLLIAQLTDTYQKVQQDAQRGLEVNRAWIVARVELNSFFFGRDYRKSHYVESEVIRDLKKVLTKWDSPPLNEMNKYVHDIWNSLDNHKMNLMTLQHRMARQEHTLLKMQDQLNFLIAWTTGNIDDVENSKSGESTVNPKFTRSHSEPRRHTRNASMNDDPAKNSSRADIEPVIQEETNHISDINL